MTVARYGTGFKNRALARLRPPECASVEDVARDAGVQPHTVQRWARESEAAVGEHLDWTAAERLDAVLATSMMDELAKSAWCRVNGVHLHDLLMWRQSAMDALGSPKAPVNRLQSQSKEDRRRIQELERDLKRKNDALAETTALLVLSKEMAAIFRKAGDE